MEEGQAGQDLGGVLPQAGQDPSDRTVGCSGDFTQGFYDTAIQLAKSEGLEDLTNIEVT